MSHSVRELEKSGTDIKVYNNFISGLKGKMNLSSLNLDDLEMVALDMGELREGTLCPEVKGFRMEGGLVVRVFATVNPKNKAVVYPFGEILEVEVRGNDFVRYAPIIIPKGYDEDGIFAVACNDKRGDNLRIFIPYGI
jgi:hypothetical protein